jgi:hypothetical protein
MATNWEQWNDAEKAVFAVEHMCEGLENFGVPPARLTMALMVNAAAYAIRENTDEKTFLEMCTTVFQRVSKIATEMPVEAKA